MRIRLNKTELRDARTRQGLTVTDAAERAGICRAYLSVIESNPDRIKNAVTHVKMAQRLARAYGLKNHEQLLIEDVAV